MSYSLLLNVINSAKIYKELYSTLFLNLINSTEIFRGLHSDFFFSFSCQYQGRNAGVLGEDIYAFLKL